MSDEPQSYQNERNLIVNEVESEKPEPIPQKLKIQPSKRRRQRPHSCKKYEPAIQKMKNRAFMLSKNTTSNNRLKRYFILKIPSLNIFLNLI